MARTVDFSVTIRESSRELSPKEKVMMKDISNAVKLDTACEEEAIVIYPAYHVILDVHNSKSDNPDYTNYVIVDKEGKKYVTGSPSFWNAYTDIMSEMYDVDDEDWALEVYKLDSKNYSGKKFLTCSII